MVLEAFGAPLIPQEREIPKPGEGEVVLKVGACGVCQTDLKVCQGNHPAVRDVPVIPGHEVAGEIVEVGKNIDKGYLGKRVVVYAYNVCGECEFCRAGRESLCTNLKGQVGFSMPGGFAEYIKIPVKSVFTIDDNVTYEKASILTDAVATPYHAIKSKARVKEGETIAVIGAGGLGLHAIQIAKLFGAKVIAIDLKDLSLKLAKDMGADWIIKGDDVDLPATVNELTSGQGVSAVFEFTGNPDVESLALELLKVAGKMVLVAYDTNNPFQVNSLTMVSREIEIYGARWCGREEFKECVDLVSTGKIEPYVGEAHPLLETNSVLKRLQEGEILGRAVLVPEKGS
jgi:2-desacetyl-2-hydroxyethyl bacteriochlorophyllide A dehydrogenase